MIDSLLFMLSGAAIIAGISAVAAPIIELIRSRRGRAGADGRTSNSADGREFFETEWPSVEVDGTRSRIQSEREALRARLEKDLAKTQVPREEPLLESTESKYRRKGDEGETSLFPDHAYDEISDRELTDSDLNVAQYPIVRKHTFSAVGSRKLTRLFGGADVREHSFRPSLTHVLVYKRGSDYIVDHGGPDSKSNVESSTSVSLVDMRHNVAVEVSHIVDSADADKFAIQAVFLCTVTDPATVVRNGVDAAAALTGYLTSFGKLSELGSTYPLEDIGRMREEVDAYLRAHVQVEPPYIAGMAVELSGVSVATAYPIAEAEAERRRLQLAKDIDLLRTRSEHERNALLADLENERINSHVLREQQRESMRAEFERKEREKESRFRGDDAEDVAAKSSNSRLSWFRANAANEISDRELANELQEQEFAVREQKRRWENEARRHELELKKLETELKRDEAQLEQQVAAREAVERAWQLKQFELQVDLIRDAARAGHLDLVDLHIQELYNRTFGVQAATEPDQVASGGTAPALPSPGGTSMSLSDEELPDADHQAHTEAADSGESE